MKETRLYSLFEKQDDKWVRISQSAFKKTQAVRIFQDALFAPYMQGLGGNVKGVRELKVVKS